MNKKTIRYAFFSSLPVMAGYVVLGAGFGILLNDKGYSFWWAFLMSLTIYAGSMQYVGVDLMAGGASLVSAALMTLMVNARHIFYGVSMVDKYREAGPEKPYLILPLRMKPILWCAMRKSRKESADAGIIFWCL